MPTAANPHRLAAVARALADPARAAMVLALIDDRARPAGELARIAGLSAATASEHLRLLRDSGLLAVRAQGRHRYYQLAGEDAAHLVESFAQASAASPAAPAVVRDDALARARTCYRHLAGRLGVALFDRLCAIDGLAFDAAAIRLRPLALDWLRRGGLVDGHDDIGALVGRTCVDWSERRLHLSGPLGNALADRMIGHGWLRRATQGRALRITPAGHVHLKALSIEVP